LSKKTGVGGRKKRKKVIKGTTPAKQGGWARNMEKTLPTERTEWGGDMGRGEGGGGGPGIQRKGGAEKQTYQRF